MEFESTYRERYAAIYRLCYRLAGSAEEARDLTQETFMRLLVISRKGKEPDNPAAWLYRVAGNLCMSYLTQKQRRTALLRGRGPEPAAVAGPDCEFEQQSTVARVRSIIAGLPPRDQVMLHLYQDSRSYDDIAAAIGVKPSSVGTLLARALAQLRKPENVGVKS